MFIIIILLFGLFQAFPINHFIQFSQLSDVVGVLLIVIFLNAEAEKLLSPYGWVTEGYTFNRGVRACTIN